MCKKIRSRCSRGHSHSPRIGAGIAIAIAIVVACSSNGKEPPEAKLKSDTTRAAVEKAKQSVSWMMKSLEKLTKELEHLDEQVANAASSQDEQSQSSSGSDVESGASKQAATPVATSNSNKPDTSFSSSEQSTNRNTPTSTPPAQAEALESANITALQTEEAVGDENSKPVLGANAPEWIRQRIIEPDHIALPIESSMFNSLEECREDLNNRLPAEVKKILDAHVFQQVPAESFAQLTNAFIRKSLITENLEFDNLQDRPSGTYHQLWVQLHLDKDLIEELRGWERPVITEKRVTRIGMAMGIVLAAISAASGTVGLLARREKSKLSQS